MNDLCSMKNLHIAIAGICSCSEWAHYVWKSCIVYESLHIMNIHITDIVAVHMPIVDYISECHTQRTWGNAHVVIHIDGVHLGLICISNVIQLILFETLVMHTSVKNYQMAGYKTINTISSLILKGQGFSKLV